MNNKTRLKKDTHFIFPNKISFYFHYNKPESKKEKSPKMSVHFDKKCHIVNNIVCNVPTKGRINKKRQPHFVMTGKASCFYLDDNDVMIIYP